MYPAFLHWFTGSLSGLQEQMFYLWWYVIQFRSGISRIGRRAVHVSLTFHCSCMAWSKSIFGFVNAKRFVQSSACVLFTAVFLRSLLVTRRLFVFTFILFFFAKNEKQTNCWRNRSGIVRTWPKFQHQRYGCSLFVGMIFALCGKTTRFFLKSWECPLFVL